MPTTDEHLEQISEGIDHQIIALTEQVDALRSLLGQYVSRDELENKLLSSVTNQLTTRLDEIDSAGETRHAEFVRHYEQRLESLATKTELEGVVTASAENANRLTILETSSSTSIATLKERLDKVEDKQLTLDASIRDIRGDTEKVATNAAGMRTTFDEFVKRDERRQKDTDREIDALKIAEAHTVNDIMELQQTVNKHHRNINDQRTWVIETLNPIELVIMGDKESGTAGIVTQLGELKTQNFKLESRQLTLENGLSAFVKFINHPLGRGIILVLMAGNFISFLTDIAR